MSRKRIEEHTVVAGVVVDFFLIAPPNPKNLFLCEGWIPDANNDL